MQDDIILKQGDLAEDDDHVFFIIEGLAEVIQERKDFAFYSLVQTEEFFKGMNMKEL